jgi:phosphatidylglycerol:prolipoprotein diacylglycerol transferase
VPALFTYPDIDPVAIDLGYVQIRWYGLMYVAGFAVGWLGCRARAKSPTSPLTPLQVDDLVTYIMVGVIVGGRVGYMLLYDFGNFIGDPLSLFLIWQGGMSFHGGLLGVLAAMWLFARRNAQPFFAVADLMAPWVPPGLGFGRIGNFLNNELWGAQTSPDAPWAVIVDGVARHPSQLYEAFLEGLVLFLILWTYSRRQRPRAAVSGLFLLFYGLFRSAVEFIRMPDNGIYVAFGWLTKGQVFSAPMIIVGIILIVAAYRRDARPSAAAS